MENINILLIALLGVSLLLLVTLVKQQREMRQLMEVEIPTANLKKKKKLLVKKINYLYSLEESIQLFFQFKKNKQKAPQLYYGILLSELALFVGFLIVGKPIFAIAFPLTLHYSALSIIKLLTLTIHYYIQKELPNAIKHLIKVMSKTSDLKTIMYETSKNLNEPLRGIFFDMSRKMISDKPEKVVMEQAEEIDNIWFYAFVFLLVSYKEQSRKKDIITNLSTLATMLDKETYVKEKAITDKKFVTIMNYLLVLLAIALLVANLIWNREVAISFFFSNMTGMLALLFGIWSIVGTVVVNIIMTRRTG